MITAKPWESIDFQLTLKTPKNPEKSTSYSVIHESTTNQNLLLVDLPLPRISKNTYKSFSLDDLIKLKDTKKRMVKKMIKDYNVIVPTNIAAKVLKSFGKIFQRYSKTPILVSNSFDCAVIEKRSYYRLEPKRMQGKLGSAKEENSVLMDRLNFIIESIKVKGYEVTEKLIKSTQGKPIIL